MVADLDLATLKLKSKTTEFDLVFLKTNLPSAVQARPSRGVVALDVRVRSAARCHAGLWASSAVESSSSGVE
jgi:hypothetical protein